MQEVNKGLVIKGNVIVLYLAHVWDIMLFICV